MEVSDDEQTKNFKQIGSTPLEDSDEDPFSVNAYENLQISNDYEMEYFPNSNANANGLTNKVNEKEDGGSLSESSINPNNPIDNVQKFLELNEKCNSMKKSLSSSALIMYYRMQLENSSNDATKNNLDKIKRIQSLIQEPGNNFHVFKLHYKNLLLQQKNFDDVINSVKHNCFIMKDVQESNIDDIIEKGGRIKMQVENECCLFKRKLPGYAYKSVILNALKGNQVIIISADCSYFFSTVTPIIAMSTLCNYTVVSCENSNIAGKWVKYDVDKLIKHHIDGFSSIDFMNPESMLNYLKDGKISGKSCYILNLPLKRSIVTDLLLATLKETLLQQKDSKLILLLSLFDDVKKYQKYFLSLRVFSLEVPKLLFPVKTIWKKDPLVIEKYKEDVISTALSIHILNEPGDILAFLPSLAEAKATILMFIKKIQELKCDNIQYFLLHKNINSNILDFKQPLNHDKRKIFFATHCMEAIPLQSVLYVIDCGSMQDYKFDYSKNLDVLTTGFVSRARARLRKSLIGVYTTAGICYRIFNKENFCVNMSSYELPDMLTLNPFNTLIKLFRHHPEKALSLQFVESVTDIVKYNTVKQLENFKAIKDGKLTPQLGERIVKLPFNARHSKFLLQGIQWGFAYEAAILVAYFSTDSHLFKIAKDEKDQQVIAAKKLDLLQHESDPLSFLYIFKCWMENNCSIPWCEQFHINFISLNMVKAKTSEICQIVCECLNETVNQRFSHLENSSTDILKLLFQCFSDNLCVFSGHNRCGYRILSSSQTAHIDPSSIVCKKDNLPQLIIYDKIVKRDDYFLLGITAIPQNVVLSGLTDEKSLGYEYSDIFERELISETIGPIDGSTIKQLLLGEDGKKLLQVENSIKEMVKSDYIVIDPCAETGYVDVYALEPVLKDAVNMVHQILKNNINDAIHAEKVSVLEYRKEEMVIPLEIKWVVGAKITSVKVKEGTQSSLSENDSNKFVSGPMKDNIAITSIELKFDRSFKITGDIEKIKNEIRENCEECSNLIDFDVIIPKPKDMATISTACVNVFGCKDLTAAARELSNIRFGNFKVTAIPVYRSVVRVNYKVYEALESRIKVEIERLKFELGKIFSGKDLFCFEVDRIANTSLVLFRLSSNDMKIMKYLQKTINELLEGEVLNGNHLKNIHKLFWHGGHMWLRTLEKTKRVLLLKEHNSKVIRVYGSRESCFKVKECILNFLEDSEKEAVEKIVLSKDETNKVLMKCLIKKYSAHLEPFVEDCGLRSAELDIKARHLLLHGNRRSIEKAKKILKCLPKFDSTEEYPLLSGGDLCSVCAYPAFNRTIRLKHCGHLYCHDCISALVEQAKFPIQCCADNCSEGIAVYDIVKILDEDDTRITKLLHSSLNDYLERNRSEIFYCPAPDCPMFAYKSDISEKWACPLCRNEICCNCKVIYHYGLTCNVYQCSKNDLGYSSKLWKKSAAQYKDCPKCKTVLEKNESFDYIFCISCKAHFCWVCCREFPTEVSIYNHIPFCDQHSK